MYDHFRDIYFREVYLFIEKIYPPYLQMIKQTKYIYRFTNLLNDLYLALALTNAENSLANPALLSHKSEI